MIQVLSLGTWSVAYGGPAYPVWELRHRPRRNQSPVPLGPSYPDLFELVAHHEAEGPEPVLWALLQKSKIFLRSPDYLFLTEPMRRAA